MTEMHGCLYGYLPILWGIWWLKTLARVENLAPTYLEWM
jgi:hypothetical protein